MARLGIAKDFLADYAGLQKPIQKAVDDAIAKFGHATHAGLHLEKIAKARDPRIRTIRITDFYRGVVLAPRNGDEYLLLTVLPHDNAIAYAISHRFSVNQALGVLEVRDQGALDTVEPELRQAASASPTLLFAGIKDSVLRQLGIDDDLIRVVRLFTSDLHLQALAPLLPAAQYNVLVGLAAGLTPEEVWAEVSAYLPTGAPETVDTEDISAAIERTPDRFVLVSGPDELAAVLAHPFDAWRVFLHPAQRDIALRPSYAGPALVSGGAGTGKTVTALHRATFLAARGTTDGGTTPILLTTFTRNLADALRRQLELLSGDKVLLSLIEVLNVDKLANRVVTEFGGHPVAIASAETLHQVWTDAARSAAGFSPTFLRREWEQVILAQRLTELDAYLAARRHGRGTGVRADQRTIIWNAIRQAVDTLHGLGVMTYPQVADEAARILTERGDPPYRHLIVDEGQDLHPAQWRLLRAAVAPGPDDLFIAADPNQRIYDSRVSLASLGIDVRGRSRRLTVSYRTTQEILAWAVRLLAGAAPDGLDGEPDALSGYRSPVHGRAPVVAGCRDRIDEHARLVEQVQAWLSAGVEPHAIGVAARSGHLAEAAREALGAAGIRASSTSASKVNAVWVGTMHGMKGLEFRCVAVIGVDAGTVPAASAVTPAEEDPASNAHDLLRERCVLFVACTRARDGLYVSYTGEPSPFLPAR